MRYSVRDQEKVCIITQLRSLAERLHKNGANVNTAVLLIDNDLSFAFWIGKALDQAGYQAFPARNEADAMVLLSEIPMNPGLLVLGEGLDGVEDLAVRWRAQNKNLRIVRLFGDNEEPASPMRGVDAEFRKPAGRKEEELLELLLAIERSRASAGELMARSRA